MRLYTLGYKEAYRSETLTPKNASQNDFTPTIVLQANSIKVLWSSWCDSVIAYRNDTDIWTIEYGGTGLTFGQKDHLVRSEKIRNAIEGNGAKIEFFGSAMHEGLRGYVMYGPGATSNEVAVFPTDVEVEAGAPTLQVYHENRGHDIKSICMRSDGSCMVSTVNHATDDHQVLYLKALDDLQEQVYLGSNSSPMQTITDFNPTRWLTNSTTATALESGGKTYTATFDPRYSKCLGRDYKNTTDFVPVDYLSETYITIVASGGYMSAAVSSEGELFLWGQTIPGSDNVLSVLKEDSSSMFDGSTSATTVNISDDGQDDIVKCLKVHIEGEQAWVYDVAIGHGHVLLAAEVRKAGCATKRAVLSAGANSKGQLGLETRRAFVEDFEEITALSGLKIEQLCAAGWSTLVVATRD